MQIPYQIKLLITMQKQEAKKEAIKSLQHQKQIYDKLMNNVYDSIKQKQLTLRKKSIADIPASLPKLNPKDFIAQCYDCLQKQQPTKNRGNSQATNRCKVYTTLLSHIDDQQRKVNSYNMQLLGLQIKKIGFTDHSKKKLQKNTQLSIQNPHQEDIIRKNSQQKIQTINNNTIDIQSLKQQMEDNIRASTISKRRNRSSHRANSFRLKQKPVLITSKTIKFEKTQKNEKIQKNEKKKIININAQFSNPIYDSRFSSYRQLIFKVNFAHNVYINFTKYDNEEGLNIIKSDEKYRAWIGSGNNGALIKSLIKKRFWWTIKQEKVLDKSLNVEFVWSQLKMNEIYKKQVPTSSYQVCVKEEKTQKDLQGNEKQEKIRKAVSPNRKLAKRVQIRDQNYLYKVLNQEESAIFKQKMIKYQNRSYQQKKIIFGLKQYSNQNVKIHNHLINNFYLGNKKALFYNLKQYYELIGQSPFQKIPLTFHIKIGTKDLEYKRFVSYYKKRQLYIKKQQKQIQYAEQNQTPLRNVWIVKPGQLTNRGNGITVIDEIYQLNSIIKREGKHQNGTDKTFIVQLYIDHPMLYQKRKFDLRHYILITHLHGIMKAYWFNQGYIRTTSYEFDIQNFDREVHLTNDAVQKYCDAYGKYEAANKLSYADFQRYLDVTYKKKYNFYKTILPQMKEISTDAVKSAFLKLSPQRLKHNFQIFGLDFLIDRQFKPWLIQINTNPCLQLPCPLLTRIIPQMLDQALRLSLDVIFPPPCHYPNTAKHLVPQSSLQAANFQLIFDEKRDGQEIKNLYQKNKTNLLNQIGQISDDEVYEDDGKQLLLDQLLQL